MPETSSSRRILSADSHLEVSPDRWRPYVDKEFQGYVPTVVKLDGGGDTWMLPNSPRPVPLGMNFGAGIPRKEWNRPISYADNPPGCGGGDDRLRDLDSDGIDAEVGFPAVNGQRSLHGLIPPEAYIAVCKGYNDWLSQEFCSADPDRLLGMALLPATSVDDAIEEYLRVSTMSGIRGVILHHWPHGGAAPAPEDDRFWAVVVEAGFPVTAHVGLGGGAKVEPTDIDKKTSKKTTNWNSQITPERSLGANTFPQHCMVQFILSGVLDRFPSLRMFFAETGVGWIPAWLDSADRSYIRHQPWTRIELPGGRLPSDYIRKHFLWSFQDDFYGVAHRHEVGVEQMMWATDFPHSATDWPHSRKLVDHLFDGVAESEAQAILGGNLAGFLNL